MKAPSVDGNVHFVEFRIGMNRGASGCFTSFLIWGIWSFAQEAATVLREWALILEAGFIFFYLYASEMQQFSHLEMEDFEVFFLFDAGWFSTNKIFVFPNWAVWWLYTLTVLCTSKVCHNFSVCVMSCAEGWKDNLLFFMEAEVNLWYEDKTSIVIPL